MIPQVPQKQAKVNIQRNKRSKTIATYFQSSITYSTHNRLESDMNAVPTLANALSI
jgi:hypothetical protein